MELWNLRSGDRTLEATARCVCSGEEVMRSWWMKARGFDDGDSAGSSKTSCIDYRVLRQKLGVVD